MNRMAEVYHQVQEFSGQKKTWNQIYPSKQRGMDYLLGIKGCNTVDFLFYGRMYLPELLLEGLYAKKLSPTKQFILLCFNDPKKNDGSTVSLRFYKKIIFSSNF